ncbi:MAG TPA: hypothetical protein VN886_05640 [Acidimicrobiales bacterium]|nr:hypothetical protein [Acidimicrobiales bacterium]
MADQSFVPSLLESSARRWMLIAGWVATLSGILVWATNEGHYGPWIVVAGLLSVVVSMAWGARDQHRQRGQEIAALTAQINLLKGEATERAEEIKYLTRQRDQWQTEAFKAMREGLSRAESNSGNPAAETTVHKSQWVTDHTEPEPPQRETLFDQ